MKAGSDVFCIPFQEEMTNALATMRVDYDQVNLKPVTTSSNRLLEKRRKKSAAGGEAQQTKF